MAIFFGTFENRIDSKNRVSVPVPLRQELGRQPVGEVVAFCSFRDPAIEAAGSEFMEDLRRSLQAKALFSDEHDRLSTAIFADCYRLAIDKEGRIVLPARLVAHAGITDRVAFVGKGDFFQIWNPEPLQRHVENARLAARTEGLTLTLGPRTGAGA